MSKLILIIQKTCLDDHAPKCDCQIFGMILNPIRYLDVQLLTIDRKTTVLYISRRKRYFHFTVTRQVDNSKSMHFVKLFVDLPFEISKGSMLRVIGDFSWVFWVFSAEYILQFTLGCTQTILPPTSSSLVIGFIVTLKQNLLSYYSWSQSECDL